MHCAYYDANLCRSCTELPIPYELQLLAKERRCRELLAPHGAAEWLTAVPSAESGFRNKAKMVVSGTTQEPLLGIRNEQGVAVDLSECPLYPRAMQACFPRLAEFITAARLEPYDIATRRGELKFLLLTLAEHSGELMLRFVLRSNDSVSRIRKFVPSLLATLPQLRVISVNLQPEHKAVLEGEQEILLTEEVQLTMRLNGMPLHLRPRSFFQTNTDVAAALYAQAREWVDEAAPASVWDLYCGVGGFALHVADGTREVTGIETSVEAIASAVRSRDEMGLARVHFEAMDATAFARGAASVPELVIVNPPRRGIGAELCRWLEDSDVRTLVYSSCNAESLARDLALVPGFKLKRARLLDMFPHTRHYEVLALLDRAD